MAVAYEKNRKEGKLVPVPVRREEVKVVEVEVEQEQEAEEVGDIGAGGGF